MILFFLLLCAVAIVLFVVTTFLSTNKDTVETDETLDAKKIEEPQLKSIINKLEEMESQLREQTKVNQGLSIEIRQLTTQLYDTRVGDFAERLDSPNVSKGRSNMYQKPSSTAGLPSEDIVNRPGDEKKLKEIKEAAKGKTGEVSKKV